MACCVEFLLTLTCYKMNWDSVLSGLQTLTNNVENFEPLVPKNSLGLRLNTPLYTLDSELKKFPYDLKVGHLNTVSIPKHFDELKQIVNKFQIFAASETNIRPNTPESLYNFEGFNFFGSNRKKGTLGVGLYIDDKIESKRIRTNYKESQPEMLFVECKFRKTILLVGVVYKSPGVSYKAYGDITESIAAITTKYDHVILLGDYNVNYLRPDTPETKFFKTNILEQFGLEQVITKPTRISKNSRSLIDLIVVNNPRMVKHSDVVDLPGLSDHSLIYITYSIKRPKFKPKKVIRRDFRKFSSADFNKDIENINWLGLNAIQCDNLLNVSSTSKMNSQISVFENYFLDVVNKHAPFREITIKKPINCTWMTDDLVKLMDSRDLYKKYFNETNDPYFYEKFKELKNKVTHSIRRAKIADFNANINSKLQNIKLFHSNLKSYNIVETGLKKNNHCSFSPTELNDFFSANNNAHVDPNILAREILRIENSTAIPKSFRFRKVTEREIVKVVRDMKSNSCGIDNIGLFFIKNCINIISAPLSEIFNFSIEHRIFPDRWKIAKITPIPKVKNPTRLKDYRPISLLSTLSKIIEKLVSTQMREYFLGKKLLNPFQSAYKENHGCPTALLHISDYIYDAMDSGEIVFMVLLDYSKAFDLANHDLIIAKLKMLGFEQSALCWLKSYLKGRCQKVVIDKDESSLAKLENGVPQGSILGPLLFTILINDISLFIKNCQYHQYADDTQLYVKTRVENAVDTIININEDLERIANFSKNTFLKINEEKSKIIVLGSKKKLAKLTQVKQIALAEIVMNEYAIERVFDVRNLGIVFDQYMSWDAHVKGIVSNAYYRLKLAYRYSRFLSENSKLRVVESYILALFNFGCPVLQNLSYNTNAKIQKLQNSCIRFIFNVRKYEHISHFYKKKKILNMSDRRDIQSLTIIHNIVNERAPDYLIDKVKFNFIFHDHPTRGKGLIRVPKARTNFGLNRFIIKYSKLYNEIVSKINIKKNISTQTFKVKVKKYFINLRYSD